MLIVSSTTCSVIRSAIDLIPMIDFPSNQLWMTKLLRFSPCIFTMVFYFGKNRLQIHVCWHGCNIVVEIEDSWTPNVWASTVSLEEFTIGGFCNGSEVRFVCRHACHYVTKVFCWQSLSNFCVFILCLILLRRIFRRFSSTINGSSLKKQGIRCWQFEVVTSLKRL